jgi:hypothetical protein
VLKAPRSNNLKPPELYGALSQTLFEMFLLILHNSMGCGFFSANVLENVDGEATLISIRAAFSTIKKSSPTHDHSQNDIPH